MFSLSAFKSRKVFLWGKSEAIQIFILSNFIIKLYGGGKALKLIAAILKLVLLLLLLSETTILKLMNFFMKIMANIFPMNMRILINVWLWNIMMDIYGWKDHKFIPFQINIVTFAEQTHSTWWKCVQNNNFENVYMYET